MIFRDIKSEKRAKNFLSTFIVLRNYGGEGLPSFDLTLEVLRNFYETYEGSKSGREMR